MNSSLPEFNFFGNNAELDHVGIAVRSIESFSSTLEKVRDPVQKVNVAFFSLHGTRVELIEPDGESSPVNGILEKGQSLYHLCYKVDNIDNALAAAKQNGFHQIAKPVEAFAFENRKIVWLFSKLFGLIELVEGELSE